MTLPLEAPEVATEVGAEVGTEVAATMAKAPQAWVAGVVVMVTTNLSPHSSDVAGP